MMRMMKLKCQMTKFQFSRVKARQCREAKTGFSCSSACILYVIFAYINYLKFAQYAAEKNLTHNFNINLHYLSNVSRIIVMKASAD